MKLATDHARRLHQDSTLVNAATHLIQKNTAIFGGLSLQAADYTENAVVEGLRTLAEFLTDGSEVQGAVEQFVPVKFNVKVEAIVYVVAIMVAIFMDFLKRNKELMLRETKIVEVTDNYNTEVSGVQPNENVTIDAGKVDPDVPVPEDCCGDIPNVISIVLPEGLVGIAPRAFQGMKSLATFTFPKGYKGDVVESETFKNCSNLTDVDFNGAQIKEIQRLAFKNCTSLFHLELPSSVTRLHYQCFRNTGLRSLVIPENVNEITNLSFIQDCRHLHTIRFKGVPSLSPSFDEDLNCPKLKSVVFDFDMTSAMARANAMYDDRDLTQAEQINYVKNTLALFITVLMQNNVQGLEVVLPTGTETPLKIKLDNNIDLANELINQFFDKVVQITEKAESREVSLYTHELSPLVSLHVSEVAQRNAAALIKRSMESVSGIRNYVPVMIKSKLRSPIRNYLSFVEEPHIPAMIKSKLRSLPIRDYFSFVEEPYLPQLDTSTALSDMEFVRRTFHKFAPELVSAIRTIFLAEKAAVRQNKLEDYLPSEVWKIVFSMINKREIE